MSDLDLPDAPQAVCSEDRPALEAKTPPVPAQAASRRLVAPAVITPDLISHLYRGALGRNPSPAEQHKALAVARKAGTFESVLSKLVHRQVFTAGLSPNVVQRPLSFGTYGPALRSPDIMPLAGFHGREQRHVWVSSKASAIIPEPVLIEVGCGYLRAGDRRVVTIDDGQHRHVLELVGGQRNLSVVVGGFGDGVTRFEADGAWVPADTAGHDTRQLAFQIMLQPAAVAPAFTLPVRPAQGCAIVAVHATRKEHDSLLPITRALADYGAETRLVDIEEVSRQWARYPGWLNVFLVSSNEAYSRLVAIGCKGRFIYAEHGAAPLKAYTYGVHYANYDLALLPGQAWCDRLETLYGDRSPIAKSVGYPKLTSKKLDPSERAARLKGLGLDPEQPVVLFAPSWSDGDDRCGIFNLRHLPRDCNAFCVPHDGDVHLLPELAHLGIPCVVPAKGESISDCYALADVLVSDISSTAVEFAALGRPVICLSTERIPDFDESFRNGIDLQVPHTPHRWDFCRTVRPPELAQALHAQLQSPWTQHNADQARKAVEPFLACHGRDAARRAVSEILAFLSPVADEVEE
jgi:hypothetical protein